MRFSRVILLALIGLPCRLLRIQLQSLHLALVTLGGVGVMGKSTIIVKRDSVFVQLCEGPIGKASDKVCSDQSSRQRRKVTGRQASMLKSIFKEPVGETENIIFNVKVV